MRKDVPRLGSIPIWDATTTINAMSVKKDKTTGRIAGSKDPARLLEQYGCDMTRFIGPDGLYKRHLAFDNIRDLPAIGARERFEAMARSLRDVLSKRWVATEKGFPASQAVSSSKHQKCCGVDSGKGERCARRLQGWRHACKNCPPVRPLSSGCSQGSFI